MGYNSTGRPYHSLTQKVKGSASSCKDNCRTLSVGVGDFSPNRSVIATCDPYCTTEGFRAKRSPVFGLPRKRWQCRHKVVAVSSLRFCLWSFSHLVRKLHIYFAVAVQYCDKSKQFGH